MAELDIKKAEELEKNMILAFKHENLAPGWFILPTGFLFFLLFTTMLLQALAYLLIIGTWVSICRASFCWYS